MCKLITTSQYLGYPINNKINPKSGKKYDIKQSNMKEVYLALVHARDKMNRPIALRYTLGLDNDHSFDISKLTRKIKLTKTTKHAKRHFWLNDVCTCHGLLPSHSA